MKNRKPYSKGWITCDELKSCVKHNGECWEWQYATQRGGYGMFRRHGFTWAAHRVSYFMFNKNAPLASIESPEVFICHSCDNPKCINPKHLFVGDVRTNTRDKVRKMRQHFGERSPNSKFTERDIRNIFKLNAAGWSQNKIARKYGIRQGYVSNILLKKVWKHTKHTGEKT